jgi:hypothetical protein
MEQIKKYLFLTIALLLSNLLHAQAMPDGGIMRSNGKILVVMSVVVIILIGLFIYLLSIDRKIAHLEKDAKNK